MHIVCMLQHFKNIVPQAYKVNSQSMQEKEWSGCFKRMEGIAGLKFKEATKTSLTITKQTLAMGYNPDGGSPTTHSLLVLRLQKQK